MVPISIVYIYNYIKVHKVQSHGAYVIFEMNMFLSGGDVFRWLCSITFRRALHSKQSPLLGHLIRAASFILFAIFPVFGKHDLLWLWVLSHCCTKDANLLTRALSVECLRNMLYWKIGGFLPRFINIFHFVVYNIKYIEVSGWKVTKCEKVQAVWRLLQGVVNDSVPVCFPAASFPVSPWTKSN